MLDPFRALSRPEFRAGSGSEPIPGGAFWFLITKVIYVPIPDMY
jgi:hypothetical protein